jgi:hypothetical protein|tara:strand:- start:615 stop:1742 length:1128 start_codon:yes stop_codon:yes gene_type:complete
MVQNKTEVLIYVEDPGAANYVAELPEIFSRLGISFRLLADGLAKICLKDRGIYTEAVESGISACQILTEIKPRLLLVGTAENPDTLGLSLIHQAKLSGIESIGAIDAYGNADLRFRGRSGESLTYATDWLFVPTELVKDSYAALGYSADRVIVCGHPHYDFVRETALRLTCKDRDAFRQRLFPGVSVGQKVLAFVSEGSARTKPRTQTYLSECTFPCDRTSVGRTEIVLNEFLDAIKLVSPRPYMVLRPHPKDVIEDYDKYLDEFDLISSSGSSIECLYAADLVVGMTGTVMMEAALMGLSSLAIVPRTAELELLPTIQLGITPFVTTQEQLRSTIVDFLQNRMQIMSIDLDKVIVRGALQRIVAFVEKRLERLN